MGGGERGRRGGGAHELVAPGPVNRLTNMTENSSVRISYCINSFLLNQISSPKERQCVETGGGCGKR